MWVALRSPDNEVRTRAICAAVLAGDANGWRHCLEAVRTSPQTSRPLVCLLAVLGSHEEHALIIKAFAEREVISDALWALSFAGTRAAVDACVAQSGGAAAGAAVHAIRWITGLDVPAPEPGAETVQNWWSSQRTRFDPVKRYQQGVPFSFASLRSALTSGPTDRRPALAAELCARTAGLQRVQTWAFCQRQRLQLGQIEALDPQLLQTTAKAVGFAALESH